jgi:DNA polymerase III alpha subunit
MRRALLCLLLAVWPAVVHAAEPLTLILIHIIRQQIANAVENAIEQAQRERERAVVVLPRAPHDIDDQRLRALIDEGFIHLSRSQRDEVFASVKRILASTDNSAARAALVQDLAMKASAVRQAHEQLSALSPAEKRALAIEARGEYVKLPPDERQQMVQVLQAGIVPLPRDLNEMILAEFGSVAVVPAVAPAVSPSAK